MSVRWEADRIRLYSRTDRRGHRVWVEGADGVLLFEGFVERAISGTRDGRKVFVLQLGETPEAAGR